MRQGTLVHPSWLTRLAPTFFASTATVQRATMTQSSTGAQVATWAALSGHEGLRCRIAPATATEVRSQTQVFAEYTHTVVLAGYYATVTELDRVVVDSVTYEIVGVQFDGNDTMTRLRVRVVR